MEEFYSMEIFLFFFGNNSVGTLESEDFAIGFEYLGRIQDMVVILIKINF